MSGMDRREFLQWGAAGLAAGALAPSAFAQAGGSTPASAASAAPLVPVKKLKVDAYSRHLQWLRTADEVAQATIEMGYDGVDITVRPYPGHVDPEKVTTDLPPFVKTIRSHGLQVVTITAPITDADSPNAEKILGTASELGLTHYWWGTFRYDQTKPAQEQLEALKPRVEKLAKLNERYKLKAMYHTYSGNMMVGAAIWDFLSVLQHFDPQYVGFHYDIGHMTNAGGNGTWALNLRAAGKYIAGVSAKDSEFFLDLKVPEGGPFTGTPASLNQRGGFGGPGGPGGPGGAAGGGGRPGGAPGGAGAAAEAAQREQAAAERGVQGPPAAAGGGAPGGGGGGRRAGGGGGARGAGGPGGGGAPGGANPNVATGMGGGGMPNPWKVKYMPLGEGNINLPMFASILKEINFSGPIEVQAEYPNGGAENAMDKITLPKAIVLGNMKRDRLTLKAGFAASGLL